MIIFNIFIVSNVNSLMQDRFNIVAGEVVTYVNYIN